MAQKKTADLRRGPPWSSYAAIGFRSRPSRPRRGSDPASRTSAGRYCRSPGRRRLQSAATCRRCCSRQAEVVLVGQPRRESQIEEALSSDLRVMREAVRPRRRQVQVGILAQSVVLDASEVPPLTRNTEAVRQIEADPQLVPPLRIGRREHRAEAALRSIEAGAIINAVQRAVAERDARIDPRVEDQVLGPRTNEARVKRTPSGKLVIVGGVEVECPWSSSPPTFVVCNAMKPLAVLNSDPPASRWTKLQNAGSAVTAQLARTPLNGSAAIRFFTLMLK